MSLALSGMCLQRKVQAPKKQKRTGRKNRDRVRGQSRKMKTVGYAGEKLTRVESSKTYSFSSKHAVF